MQKLPQEIVKLVDRLKHEYSPYLEVKISKNGRYVLYEYIHRYDKTLKREIRRLLYLGTITTDGVLIPARHKHREHIAQTAENTYGIVNEAEAQPESIIVPRHDIDLLKFLSMNARAPVNAISKRIGLSRTATEYNIKNAENRYGIKYIAEINAEKLGYLRYVVFVKFEKEIPLFEELEGILNKEPTIQLALLTQGNYDLVFYILAKDNTEVAYFIHRIRTKTQLKSYVSRWYVSPYLDSYGYIPIRDKFIEALEEKVWHRTKEKPRPLPTDLTGREYLVLKELNSDGVVEFTEIERKNNLDPGAARYIYQKLLEKGILKRVTITMTKLPIKYNAIFFMEIVNGAEFDKSRKDLLLEIISDSHNISDKYSVVGDIEVPYGGLFIMPILKETELIAAQNEISTKVGGTELSRLFVTNIIVGYLCYRRFDKEHTKLYERLAEEYKILPYKEKIEYN